MDAGQLVQLFTLIAVAIGLGWFALTSAGRAGDGIAALFVPPNRTLGWPDGVQESDEPWGWRSGPRPTMAPPTSAGDDDGGGGFGDEPTPIGPGRGALIVPVAPVRPVRLVLRPH